MAENLRKRCEGLKRDLRRTLEERDELRSILDGVRKDSQDIQVDARIAGDERDRFRKENERLHREVLQLRSDVAEATKREDKALAQRNEIAWLLVSKSGEIKSPK